MQYLSVLPTACLGIGILWAVLTGRVFFTTKAERRFKRQHGHWPWER
jgi:hypothetical protein